LLRIVGALPYGCGVEDLAVASGPPDAAPDGAGQPPAGRAADGTAGGAQSSAVSGDADSTAGAGTDTSAAGFGPAGDPPHALSPSRAADFMTCPLLYRFRVIDRLPEPPTEATARGTLVHAVLERLFDRPAADRTPEAARELMAPEWERLAAANPDLAALFPDDSERRVWLREATAALDGYFTLEDPRRLEPAEREHYVETVLDSGLRLRGYIDRLDVTAAGDIRIVDYKTGKVPREAYEASALFQMKFYALVIWRLRGRIPRLLQLMYLTDSEMLRYAPDEADLRATQRKLEALWRAIEKARQSGDWQPHPSKLCDWCRHRSLCPKFGGTPPPLPEPDGALASLEPLPESAASDTLG
jgi:putative RecB family exonuclease